MQNSQQNSRNLFHSSPKNKNNCECPEDIFEENINVLSNGPPQNAQYNTNQYNTSNASEYFEDSLNNNPNLSYEEYEDSLNKLNTKLSREYKESDNEYFPEDNIIRGNYSKYTSPKSASNRYEVQNKPCGANEIYPNLPKNYEYPRSNYVAEQSNLEYTPDSLEVTTSRRNRQNLTRKSPEIYYYDSLEDNVCPNTSNAGYSPDSLEASTSRRNRQNLLNKSQETYYYDSLEDNVCSNTPNVEYSPDSLEASTSRRNRQKFFNKSQETKYYDSLEDNVCPNTSNVEYSKDSLEATNRSAPSERYYDSLEDDYRQNNISPKNRSLPYSEDSLEVNNSRRNCQNLVNKSPETNYYDSLEDNVYPKTSNVEYTKDSLEVTNSIHRSPTSERFYDSLEDDYRQSNICSNNCSLPFSEDSLEANNSRRNRQKVSNKSPDTPKYYDSLENNAFPNTSNNAYMVDVLNRRNRQNVSNKSPETTNYYDSLENNVCPNTSNAEYSKDSLDSSIRSRSPHKENIMPNDSAFLNSIKPPIPQGKRDYNSNYSTTCEQQFIQGGNTDGYFGNNSFDVCRNELSGYSEGSPQISLSNDQFRNQTTPIRPDFTNYSGQVANYYKDSTFIRADQKSPKTNANLRIAKAHYDSLKGDYHQSNACLNNCRANFSENSLDENNRSTHSERYYDALNNDREVNTNLNYCNLEYPEISLTKYNRTTASEYYDALNSNRQVRQRNIPPNNSTPVYSENSLNTINSGKRNRSPYIEGGTPKICVNNATLIDSNTSSMSQPGRNGNYNRSSPKSNYLNIPGQQFVQSGAANNKFKNTPLKDYSSPSDGSPVNTFSNDPLLKHSTPIRPCFTDYSEQLADFCNDVDCNKAGHKSYKATANLRTDSINMLSIVISTVMLLASNHEVPENYISWAIKYLNCIRNKNGQIPENIKQIQKLIETKTADKNIENSCKCGK